MSIQEYKKFSEFRVRVFNTIKSSRKKDKVYKDIDAVLSRIANSIQRGYTLPNQHFNDREIYRPYPYFEITWSRINNDRDLTVTITRQLKSKGISFKLEITESNWYSFLIWTTKWKIKKPETASECLDADFYTRWW